MKRFSPEVPCHSIIESQTAKGGNLFSLSFDSVSAITVTINENRAHLTAIIDDQLGIRGCYSKNIASVLSSCVLLWGGLVVMFPPAIFIQAPLPQDIKAIL